VFVFLYLFLGKLDSVLTSDATLEIADGVLAVVHVTQHLFAVFLLGFATRIGATTSKRVCVRKKLKSEVNRDCRGPSLQASGTDWPACT
jgi:hypothetical protein